ncbi:MAG: class I SAM-dependent methyltransferase [Polyangiaceae bacterium]|nr:class I SAM-dependent methyltransferase [Polyangiaceae bacterium]
MALPGSEPSLGGVEVARGDDAAPDPIAYYTECWVERFRAGHNPTSLAIHYGLVDDARIDFERAKLAINTHVVERLAISRLGEASLVDLGCGVGGTILDLASRFSSWRFSGVDRTPASLSFAGSRAAERGYGERVRWIQSDYAATPLSPGFDGAYAIESACHCDDKRRLLAEAMRLLRSGASFVVVDFFRTRRPLDAPARRRYAELLRGFCVADYYDEELAALAPAAGFAATDVEDLTARVLPSVARSADKARARLNGDAVGERMRFHLEACIAVEALCESGHLSYGSFRATKP